MQLETLGLALNPCASISVQGGSEPPLFLVRAPIKGAQMSDRLVNPDELPEAHDFLAAALIRGEPVDQISEQGIAELRVIGLLAPVDALPRAVQYDLGVDRLAGHSQMLDDSETRAHFEREGFAMLDRLLPACEVAELGRYYQSLAAEGFLQLDDYRGSRRHVAHSHPVADFWHRQLNERVSHLVGRATKPSYSFVSLYLEGGELKWHVDRPPCEYTITLLVDYAPLDDAGRSPWALKVRARDGSTRELYQRVGDALIFKGRELKHCRDVLPEGHRSASLLFHFVDADYDGVMA
jgi:hypothetical protein